MKKNKETKEKITIILPRGLRILIDEKEYTIDGFFKEVKKQLKKTYPDVEVRMTEDGRMVIDFHGTGLPSSVEPINFPWENEPEFHIDNNPKSFLK